MATLTQLTASTQGASFQKARIIYSAVVQLAILYRCSTQYSLPEWTKPKEINKTKLHQLDVAQNLYLCTIVGAYKLTPIAVLKHEMGFLPLQIHLEELAVAYIERTQEGLTKKHIKRECNTIQATIAHQLWPRTKPLMRPTRRDKLKRIIAAILGTDIQLADLSKADAFPPVRCQSRKSFYYIGLILFI